MSAQETFVQNVNGRNWIAAADQLNGSPMYDILPFIFALGPNGPIAVNNISGVLRTRGWFGAAQRIEWAGEVVRTRRIVNPPPGLPADQVTDAKKFLERPSAKAGSQSGSFDIVMSSPFRSGWKGGLGGPNMGGHKCADWFIQYGMDLGVKEGTEVLAAFSGHVTKFHPHTPSKDTSKVYGAQLFLRSDNNMMGGFYTHITGGPNFGIGQRITKGNVLGNTLRDHLHLALVEIVGGAPGGRYAGVDLYQHFLRIGDSPTTITVTFKQDGSPPTVS
jgi:murein DD-endopeptidase MepM/ murein hydrolase activator NlpD